MKEIKILIAEDDVVTQHLELALLKKKGYRNLRIATDGESALRMFFEQPPDLLILDYYMPHKSGFEVLEEIRDNKEFKRIPIIFVTAVDDKSKLIEALKFGATDYITKPFDQAEFLARIDAHARNYYLQKKLMQTNEKLEEVNNILIEKKRQIETDLKTARKIQEALLPKNIPPIKNLNIEYLYQASNSIGGDFLDIVRIDDETCAFYIADVAGHGVTSALITVFVREQMTGIMNSLDRDSFQPAEILNKLNRNYHKETNFIEDGMFLTIFCGILDTKSYKIKYASAGHHSVPVIFDSNNSQSLSEMGVAIGFLEDFQYTNYTVQLKSNKKIFCHTDGLIELTNSKNESFGMDRLTTSLMKNYDLHSTKLLEQIIQRGQRFSEQKVFEDDIALLLFELS
ncbi:SpoIIE family protein phosphatase [candidate division KSB1 bacterium]|nr:SpoIIE family protein phosphatase [candidate division KSB1 bacterium]